jgi:uncharacterized membrane protein
MRKLHRAYVGLAVAATSLIVTALASASAAYPLTGVSTGFVDQLTNAVTTALPIAGPIIALFVGWKVFKRLVRG